MANILDKSNKALAPVPNRNGKDLAVFKRVKFDWTTGGSPGVFRQIDKHDLNIDGRYQRDAEGDVKIRNIAANWDWLLFGTISVIQRSDNSYWVFDGGHRTRAAFYRDDIQTLPAMVHSVDDLTEEAKAFVARNTMTTDVKAFDRFTASVCAKEPTALDVESFLSDVGLRAVKSMGATSGPTDIGCISTVKAIFQRDAELAKRVIRFAMTLQSDKPLTSNILRGLFELCWHFAGRVDILSAHGDKIAMHSQRDIEIKMRQFRAECGKGGAVVEAKAILEMINKHRKNRLNWNV